MQSSDSVKRRETESAVREGHETRRTEVEATAAEGTWKKGRQGKTETRKKKSETRVLALVFSVIYASMFQHRDFHLRRYSSAEEKTHFDPHGGPKVTGTSQAMRRRRRRR